MDSTRLTCLVDDSADFRLLMQQLFRRFLPIYPVRFFADGQELVDELPRMSPKPSLILLDRHMPGLDGHQTLLWLKQHPTYQTIPVVMISADSTSLEIEGCYRAGVNSFLSKTLDVNSLKATLSTLCRYWLKMNLEVDQS